MTRKISIGGIIFNVEPVGHKILKAYLDAWKEFNPQLKKQWEELVAEHLLNQLQGGKNITTVSDVENIRKVLPEIPSRLLPEPYSSVRSGYFSNLIVGLW